MPPVRIRPPVPGRKPGILTRGKTDREIIIQHKTGSRKDGAVPGSGISCCEGRDGIRIVRLVMSIKYSHIFQESGEDDT